jgi:phosphoribosylamine--glycine ligase
MGAYAPVPFLTQAELAKVGEDIIAPMLATMRRRGAPFRGALYAGLMLTRSGPKVVEFNARFGDPETQVLMLQLEEDLLPLLEACARGQLAPRALRMHAGASVAVVMAAQGYPDSPRKGQRIEGLEGAGEGAQVFFAGVEQRGEALLTAGGRVLTVCARGADLQEARARAYAAADGVRFEGAHLRRDIGARGIRHARP